MKMIVPCDLRASSRALGKEFSSKSCLIMENIDTGIKYLITTGLLAFDGVDRFSVLAGEKQNERIDLDMARSSVAANLRLRNALALELPPCLDVYSGFKDHVKESDIAVGAEYKTHPNIGGRIVGIGAVIKVPHATTDEQTMMTRLLRIRFDQAQQQNMAGSVWYAGESALAMTVGQSDEFAFAIPIFELIAGLESKIRVYNSFGRTDHVSTHIPGRNEKKEDSWHRFQREMEAA